MRPLTRFLFALIAILVAFGAFLPLAHAQVPVVGSADFRGAPQLPPGQYRDQLVTGDSAWYALVYTNNTPYRFEVAVDGVSPAGVTLNASFIAPTLTTVDGPDAIVESNGVEYPEPAGHTNIWFLKVTMETTGQNGVEYPILITVDGVQEAGIDPCTEVPGCTLDQDYAAINTAVTQARESLDALNPQDQLSVVEPEVAGLRRSAESALTTRPAAESRLAAADAAVAELCAPEKFCEEFPVPAPKTPVLGLILGVAALAGGAFLAFKKLTRPAEEEPEEPEEPFTRTRPIAL